MKLENLKTQRYLENAIRNNQGNPEITNNHKKRHNTNEQNNPGYLNLLITFS